MRKFGKATLATGLALTVGGVLAQFAGELGDAGQSLEKISRVAQSQSRTRGALVGQSVIPLVATDLPGDSSFERWFPMPDAGHVFRAESVIRTSVMATRKFQDYFFEPATGAWIEVVGSAKMIHQGPRGTMVSDKQAHWTRALGVPMASSRAVAILSRNLGRAEKPLRIALKVLPNAERADARLVYWMDYEDRLIVVDAVEGALVHNISKHRAFAKVPEIKVYSAEGLGERTDQYGEDTEEDDLPKKLRDSCQLISTREEDKGTPFRINPMSCQMTAQNSTAIPGADEDSVRALEASGIVAQYYAEKHDRSSYDDQGSDLINIVHTGDAYDNAFWDEEHSYMAYGDGDGEKSGSYTLALDIVGHEMTHGITAATAKLIGSGESGALNEAYSDFFGIMISNMTDKDPDWTIGKEISRVQPGQSPGMRSLSEPSRFKIKTFVDVGMTDSREVPYPSKVSEQLGVGQKCSDENDQCEIHGNATIPGRASYLVAKALQTKAPRIRDRFDRAAKLYYTVLTQWLVSTDDFAAAAKDTIAACKLMYRAEDCEKVERAFVMTGMQKR